MTRLSEVRVLGKPPRFMLDPSVPTSAKIDLLERHMRGMPQVECELREAFGRNVYVRELSIPAGTFAIGRTHKFDHVCMMLSGETYVWSELDGFRHLAGRRLMESGEGVRRVFYTLRDTVWMTAHGVDDAALAREGAIDYLTVVSYEEYLACKREMLPALESTP